MLCCAKVRRFSAIHGGEKTLTAKILKFFYCKKHSTAYTLRAMDVNAVTGSSLQEEIDLELELEEARARDAGIRSTDSRNSAGTANIPHGTGNDSNVSVSVPSTTSYCVPEQFSQAPLPVTSGTRTATSGTSGTREVQSGVKSIPHALGVLDSKGNIAPIMQRQADTRELGVQKDVPGATPVLTTAAATDPRKNTGISQASVGSKLRPSIEAADTSRSWTPASRIAEAVGKFTKNVTDFTTPGTIANENLEENSEESDKYVDPEKREQLDSALTKMLFKTDRAD
jgi:hypothetical protein